jgi:hypothetical protein
MVIRAATLCVMSAATFTGGVASGQNVFIQALDIILVPQNAVLGLTDQTTSA